MLDNDYFGMAQDLRRIHKELRDRTDFRGSCVVSEKILLILKIKEFEMYCLDQTPLDFYNNYWEDNSID